MIFNYRELNIIFFLYFLVGFISDLLLNYLSRQNYAPASIKALEIYFERKTIKSAPLRVIVSAITAGLTIIAALAITMAISMILFRFLYPHNFAELWRFLLLAFCIGYLADIVIYKTQLLGATLNPYYAIAGAGLWGAISFLFSIFAVYFLQKCIFKYF